MRRMVPWRLLGAVLSASLCFAATASAQSTSGVIGEGFRLYDADRYEQANQLFRVGLDRARLDHNVTDEAEAHRGLGLVLLHNAKYSEARAELERALAGFEALGDRAAIAQASRHLAAVARGMGDNATARKWYDDALAIAEHDELLEQKARTLASLARLPDTSHEDAGQLIAEALDLSRALGLRELHANLLHNWGDRLFVAGQFAEAQQKLDEAVAIFEQIGDRRDLARALTSLGRLYRAHGQLDRAVDCYRRGLAIQEEIGDREGAIQSINATATAVELQKNVNGAHELYKKGLALAEETGSPRIINFMRGNLASTYLKLGDYTRARDLLEAVVRDPMEPYIAGYRYAALSETYIALKEYAKALEASDLAVSAVKQVGELERLPDVLYQRAEAQKANGHLREALADTRELLDAVEQLRAKLAPNDFMKRGFGEWWASTFAFAIQLHHQLGEHQRAMEVAESARARAFVDLLATRSVEGKPSDRERLADVRRVEAELRAVGADPAEPPLSLPTLTYRGEPAAGSASPLWRRWKSADPELRSFVAAEPTTVQQMVETAGRLHSTIVTYWVGAGETFIGVVRPDGQVRTATVQISEQRLSALARATQPDVKGGRGADGTKTDSPMNSLRVRGNEVVALASGGKQARRELYRLLVAPISNVLPRDDGALLTIVPHGPLFLVSFAALIDEHDRYLLERFTIHYAPSTAVLQYTAGKKQRSPVSRYLLVSDPADLPTLEGGKPLQRLPGSRQEVAAVARSLRGRDVTVLTGASAHEDQVRGAMTGRTVLHFATHGIVRDDEPFESFLAFGRAGASPPSDGRLTAQEIYDLDLHADLVILSACRTAAGRVTGDGIIGLMRAFMYAGTPTVIATLWDVADEPGLFLLPPFYDALGTGVDASRALRTAQLGFLARLRAGRVRVDGPLGHVTLPEDPLFWAGFIVVGEP